MSSNTKCPNCGREREDPEDMLCDKCQYPEASKPSHPLPEEREPVYRLVKCNERLPEKDGIVCFTMNGGYSNVFVTTRKDSSRVITLYNNQIVKGWKTGAWLEKIPAPIPQLVSKETESDLKELEKTVSDIIKRAIDEDGKLIAPHLKMIKSASKTIALVWGGMIDAVYEGAAAWEEKYNDLKNKQPAPPIPESLPTELPDGYGIVYDKVFIPCKQGVGEDYPSSVCDFDDDEQEWVPGDCFVSRVPGPVAVIPAKHYEALQASLSSMKAERDEALATLELERKHGDQLAEHWYNYLQALKDIADGTAKGLVYKRIMDNSEMQNIAVKTLEEYPQINTNKYRSLITNLTADRDFYRTESETHKKAWEEATAALADKNLWLVKFYEQGKHAISSPNWSAPVVLIGEYERHMDEVKAKIINEIESNKYPKKEVENK